MSERTRGGLPARAPSLLLSPASFTGRDVIMEQPVAFVRDNPFFKNDGCRRLVRRAPILSPRRTPAAPVVIARPAPPEKAPTTTATMNEDNAEENDNVSLGSSSSDMEYGPGIVEKLKAKFHRLSGIGGSRGETKVRRSSMEEYYGANCISPTPPTVPLSASQRLHSKSTGDMMESAEMQRFTVHRVVRIEPEDEPVQPPSISNLRRRFEPNARPLQTNYSRIDDIRSRPSDLDYSQIRSDRSAEYGPSSHSENGYGLHRENHYDSRRTIIEKEATIVRPIDPEPDYRENDDMDERVTASSTVRVCSPRPDERPAEEFKVVQRLCEVHSRQKRAESDEPEFIRVGRQLRRSSIHADTFEKSAEYSAASYGHSQSGAGPMSPPLPVVLPPSTALSPAETHSQVSIPREKHEEPKYSRTEMMRRIDTTPKTSLSEKENNSPARRYLLRRDAQLPTLSGQARIVHENSSPVFKNADFALPPDPDSARTRNPPAIVPVTQSTFPTSSDPQSSPPPEEPTPRQPPISSSAPTVSIPEQHQHVTQTIIREREEPTITRFTSKPKQEEESVSEVHQLLSRFQRSRESREAVEQTQAQSQSQSQLQQSRSFVPAVIGVRSYPEREQERESYSSQNSRSTVVSISVRGDSSVFGNADQRSNEATLAAKRQAPPPPVQSPEPTLQPDVRPVSFSFPQAAEISRPTSEPPAIPSSTPISPQFVSPVSESSSAIREKPYGDDAVELKSLIAENRTNSSEQEPRPRESSIDEEITVKPPEPVSVAVAPPASQAVTSALENELGWSSSSDDDDDLLAHKSSMHLPLDNVPIRAGDGNPVRHTFLSLAMEEDIPLLLEAMAEKHHFVFVDLDHSKPSTSSIIHPQETRKQRRIGRQVSSIKFETALPEVYTYLDESSAYVDNAWMDGTVIDYKTYEDVKKFELLEAERQQLEELSRWRRVVSASAGIAAADEQLMSSFSHVPTAVDDNTVYSQTFLVA